MRRRLATGLALAWLAALLLAGAAQAQEFGIHDFDVTFTDAAGAGQFLAGSHPAQMTIAFAANTEEDEEGRSFPVEAVKDLEIFQVPGFVGDQTAVPRCPTLDFLSPGFGNATGCADATVVGLGGIAAGEGAKLGKVEPSLQPTPIYNLEPAPGSVARLGFFVTGVPVTISIHLEDEYPNRLLASVRGVSQVLEFLAARTTLWGVPADPVHDEERGQCYLGGEACPAGVAPRPFLTLPRACEGPLATEYELDSWANPGVWEEGSAETHDDAEPPNPQGMIGCGDLSFDADTAADPSTSRAESSAGLDFRIEVSDEGLKSPSGRAKSDIEAIQMVLPAGMTANPSAAEGLGTCTEAQFEAASLEGPSCPGASKLGSLEAVTPLLEEHPLRGSVYLAEQYDNPFGTLLALYMIIRDEELGALVKLPVAVDTDPTTGRLITTAVDIPPFPLSHVDVHLRSGPRAPLITPPSCGTYETTTILYPSSGKEPIEDVSDFPVSSGPGGTPCPTSLPFTPGFEAGSENNAAGRYSPFSMRLTRRDGEQDLTRFSATLPKGLVPKIAGVPRCSDAAIAAAKSRSGRAELAAPSCPPGSRIGSVLGGAGVGSALTYVPGSVYLAGPYHGAPLSAAAIVPAVAGPFDVGTVVTRVALDLNPTTYLGEIDGAASDPIPHILEGIPLKLRDLRVSIDRPEFTLNPTSCAEMQVGATIFGSGADVFDTADDTTANATARYQAASCASLAFKPKLTLRFKGQTKRTGHPSVRAELLPRAGDANFKDAVTFLPKTTLIDAANVPGVCTRAQFAEDACPAESILGKARAFTPLLDEPLEGKVYFRSNGGARELPDLVADLKGQFRIVLVGFVDSRHGRIRTRFLNVPDAPVSKFVLRLFGGKNRGLIQNRANLCKHRGRGIFNLAGQNGRVKRTKPKIAVKCNEGKGRKSKGHPRVG
ncbi:MAG: hypothetical protein R2725_03275 [Solirubrobacterales bacterium]